MVRVAVFLLCYNEETLIRPTIEHYRRRFPNCPITIYDNHSTDRSPLIAKELNCTVIQWERGNTASNHKRAEIKSTCWRSVAADWVIVADMDEWLYITEADLAREEACGATLIRSNLFDILIPDSTSATLADVSDLHDQATGYYQMAKLLCFKPVFDSLIFTPGAHSFTALPTRAWKLAATHYPAKHMNTLSLPFFIVKNQRSFARTILDRMEGMSRHYQENEADIRAVYADRVRRSRDIRRFFAKT